MYKASQRPLNNKKDPQQFLQYGIGGENNFKMILVNDSNVPFVPVTANLPSGFKPLSSSTPKRSRKSFETIDKPVTRLQPAPPRLTMSQFIGEIPNPSVQNQNTRSSSSKTKNINFVKSTSKSFETPIVANDISSVRVKRQRSTSCQSWDSFQKQLRPILNTTAKDLNTTEKILKLILQLNSHSNENTRNMHYQEENFNIFEYYIKIKALMKASETFDDWTKKCQEKFLNSTERKEGFIDKNNQCMLSSQNAGSFKVPEVPPNPKPSAKPVSNDSEIIIANDIIPTMVNRSSQTSIISYYNKTEDILDSTLKFNSSSKNNKRQKNQPDTVFKNFENFVDSKISTKTVSETINEFSFFKEGFPDSFKTEEVFDKNDQLTTSSKNFVSFQVPEAPATLFSKPTKPKKSYFKTKRISNHKIVDSPYFNFNKAFELMQTNSHRSYGGKNSQFKEELQKLLKINTGGAKQQKKVSKAPLYNEHAAKPYPKDFGINISNDITPTANGKPQLRTSYSNTTRDLLQWIFQYNPALKNNTNQMNHPNDVFESFVDAKVSTMVSKTMDDLSIFHDSIQSEEDDQLSFSKTKFGLFTKNYFNLN